jgi:hypothetical protein
VIEGGRGSGTPPIPRLASWSASRFSFRGTPVLASARGLIEFDEGGLGAHPRSPPSFGRFALRPRAEGSDNRLTLSRSLGI